jgi:hypothetical protein
MRAIEARIAKLEAVIARFPMNPLRSLRSRIQGPGWEAAKLNHDRGFFCEALDHIAEKKFLEIVERVAGPNAI